MEALPYGSAPTVRCQPCVCVSTRDNGPVTTPQELDEHFRATLGALTAPDRRGDPSQPVRPDTTLTGATALRLFEAQLASRHLDLAARWLRSFGEGFYTIGSVAAATRPRSTSRIGSVSPTWSARAQ